MSDLRELYQEVIIDHSRHPRNFGVLEKANHQAEGYNPLCGDQLKLYLEINNDMIKAASFKGQGCAISMASASLLTEIILGKTMKEADEIFQKFHAMLTKNELYISEDLGKLMVLAGVKEFPARVKCATLAWHTLQLALENKPVIAVTE